MGCASSALNPTTLIKQYGQENILKYVQSQVGSNALTDQFSSLRSKLTQQFNSSTSTSKNPEMLDRVLSQIKQTEQEEVQKVQALKPSIPELDNAPAKAKESFIKTITSKFGPQIDGFKTQILQGVQDKANLSQYTSMLGL